MNAQRNTALGLPDLPDTTLRECTVEEEQERNIISMIGLTLWGTLCQMESEHERAHHRDVEG